MDTSYEIVILLLLILSAQDYNWASQARNGFKCFKCTSIQFILYFC